ncbi:MAG: exopolysaccharide biosynthesis protein [Burkholderiales bacterium]|nr:MAG: exopolysaccharide biosynthesis protein [Burkholderiales bacterium]
MMISTQSLSQRLAHFADQLPETGLSVGELVKQLGREGLLLLCVVLSLPFLLPVSIPGVSTIFGLLILFIGVAETLRMPIWLPGKVAGYSLTRERLQDILRLGAKWVQRLEKLARARMAWLTSAAMERFNGAMLVLAAALLMMPLAIIPFSNTLPALACIFLAVGMLSKDGLCILLGYLFNLVSALYFSLIFVLGAAVVLKYLGPYLPSWATGFMG